MSGCFPTKVPFKNVFSRKQNKDVPKVPFKKLFSRKKDMKELKGEELPSPSDDFAPPDEDQIARQEWSDSINFRIVDNIFQKVDETYDFIIVGAGSAGCVLARELFANIPNLSILVLEAGPPTSNVNDRMRMACAYPTIFRSMDSDWGYVTTLQTMPGVVDPSKVVENPSIMYPRGKIFGGCSSTGGMVYMRGQKADYDGWAAQGPEYSIWNYDGCLEAFKAVENNARQNPDEEFKKFHGFTGLLHVEDSPAPTYKIVEDVIGMAQTVGMPLNTDFNGATQNGVGKFQHTKKDGKRFTLADGYLADALNKVDTTPPFQPIGPPYGLANATGKFVSVNVKSAAFAMNIIWDGNKPNENVAIGVKYYYDGQVHNAFIAPKGEVIVCGGAINSPKLLMLSGIGPRKNLEDNQITVRKELPVGNNLKDHPLCYISGQVNVPNSTSVTQLESFNSSFEVGMIFKGNTAGTIPVKDDFLNESPDMQLYVTTTPFDPMIATKTNNTPTSPKFETISIIPALNSPTSVGRIELSDSSPFDSPKVFPTFYETPEDLYRVMSALKFARELLKQPPLSTNWGVKEIGINDDFGRFSGPNGEMTDENWETYIRAKTFTSFHPCCTVKMGPEDKGGCVNERLQVYGATNLRVVDASIFPTIPHGNLNAIAAMVGWRASKIIEEDYGKK